MVVPYFSPEEIAKLCATARVYPEFKLLLPVVVLIRHAGIRLGEAVRLRVGDWNPGEATLTIRRGGVSKESLLVLEGEIARLLTDLAEGRADGEALFLHRGGQPLTDRSIQRWLRRLAYIAGLEYRNWHHFRHSMVRLKFKGQV